MREMGFWTHWKICKRFALRIDADKTLAPHLKMSILTQTGNNTYAQKKLLQLKKVRSLKKWDWNFETLNSTFYGK